MAIISCTKCYGTGHDIFGEVCKECRGTGLLMTSPITKEEAKKYRGDLSGTPIEDIWYNPNK
jgi:RecJ-like exonuclease